MVGPRSGPGMEAHAEGALPLSGGRRAATLILPELAVFFREHRNPPLTHVVPSPSGNQENLPPGVL